MFRNLSFAALLLAFVVVFLSVIVQVSNSQLACPDYPTCYGKAYITDDVESRVQGHKQFPNSRFSPIKTQIKLSHRYSSGLLELAVLALFFVAIIKIQQRLSALGAGVALAAATAFLLLDKLAITNASPLLFSGQAWLGFWLVVVLYWLHLRCHPCLRRQDTHSTPRVLSILALLAVMVQIFSGLWLSDNSATLSCSGFPTCNGQWLPAADYLGAIDLLATLDGSTLSPDAKIAANWLHRAMAAVNFVLLSCLIFSATSSKYRSPVRKAALLLSVLLMVEISLGIIGVRLAAPLLITIAHTILAALMLLPLVAIIFYSKYDFADSAAAIDQDLASTQPPTPVPSPLSLYTRLAQQLQKTSANFTAILSASSFGDTDLDANLQRLQTALLQADLGVTVTEGIIAHLRQSNTSANDLPATLRQHLQDILQPCCQPLVIPKQKTPFVILVVGVNGVGKTTTIGKLAKRLADDGRSVLLAAGDTFRAAAVEQLQVWGERNNIAVVAQGDGADAASVIFDAVQSATAKKIEVLIADTAGRLHTQQNLMQELHKIKRIMAKIDPNAPHEVLLVLDGGTGQNAISQTKTFANDIGVTGVALTKLDGTAKGGVIFALAQQFGLPIRFVGVGEGSDDLQDFVAKDFVQALFASSNAQI